MFFYLQEIVDVNKKLQGLRWLCAEVVPNSDISSEDHNPRTTFLTNPRITE